jgi:hypothetical protein
MFWPNSRKVEYFAATAAALANRNGVGHRVLKAADPAQGEFNLGRLFIGASGLILGRVAKSPSVSKIPAHHIFRSRLALAQ